MTFLDHFLTVLDRSRNFNPKQKELREQNMLMEHDLEEAHLALQVTPVSFLSRMF